MFVCIGDVSDEDISEVRLSLAKLNAGLHSS